jgi:hypothetical protein
MTRRSALLAAAGYNASPHVANDRDAVFMANTTPVFLEDYLRLGEAFNYNADYTIMGWFKSMASPLAGTWLFNVSGAVGSTDFDVVFLRDTGELDVIVKQADTTVVDYITTGAGIVTGQWYHVTLVRSAGTVGVYLEAVQLGTFQTATVTGRTASTAIVINNWDGGGATGRPLATCGVKAWTRALSQSEIADERASIAPVSTTSLWAAYPLAGTANLTDSTAAHGAFVLTGDEFSTVAGPTNAQLADGSGQSGGPPATTALHITAGTGIAQLDMVGNALDYNASYTVMFWLWQDSGATNWNCPLLLSPANTGGLTNYDTLEIDNVGLAVRLSRKVNDAATADGVQRGTLTAATWTHIAFVGTATTLAMFVNGTQVGTNIAASASGRTAASRYMTILNWIDGAEHQPSAVYALKGWQAALTGAEITAEMAQVMAVRTTNHWATFRLRDSADLASVEGPAMSFAITAGTSTADTITAPNVPDTA